MEDARALLNSIMGADRNAGKKERKVRKFTDNDICKKFLIGFCPHELFKNTKMDLGPCGKHHNEHLKEAFEADREHARYRKKWRQSLRIQLRQLMSDVDRRMEQNQARIKEKDGSGVADGESHQITSLKEEMSEKLKQAEKAADDGKFELSKSIMREVDVIKRRMEDVDSKKSEKPAESICSICGLRVSGEELADILKYGRGWHTDGKQHLGFIEVRKMVKVLEEEEERDKRDGVKSMSPSPVRVQQPDVSTRKRSPSQKRRTSPPRQRTRNDDRRKRQSRSRSRRALPNRSRSLSPETRQKRLEIRRRRASQSRSPKNKKDGRRKQSDLSRSLSNRRKRIDKKQHGSSSPQRRRRSPQRSDSEAKPTSSGKKRSRSDEKRQKEGTKRSSQSPPRPHSVSKESDKPHAGKKMENSDASTSTPPQETATQETANVETVPPPAPVLPPKPPPPVRFVLGLGKLNLTALKKPGL